MNYKISVIMSVHNDQQNISNSIMSVLNQSFTDYEFLIIDDCSTDNTLKKIEKFTSDQRIKLFKNKKNIGLTKSLNYLIEKSTGKYIFRQDSDDISLPQRFQKQINVLEQKSFQVCTTRAINNSNNQIIPGLSSWIPKKILIKYKNPYIHGTLAIEKSLLNSVGNYNENYYYAQDFKLYLDLNEKKIKIHEIKEPLYKLNTVNNISTNFKEQQRYYFLKALNKI